MIVSGSSFDDSSNDPDSIGEVELIDPIADVTRAGLPLSAGLLAYSEEVPSRRMRGSLRRMARAVEAGHSLEDVLANEATVAAPYLRGLVRAGLVANRLGEVLGEHLNCVRRTRLIRTRTWMSLAYPLILTAAALAIVLFILIWPLPAFREIFNDFGVELPGLTIAIIRLSDVVVRAAAYWPWFLGGILVLTALLFGIRFLPGRAWRVRMWQSIPILGSASRDAALSEFCSLLAILIDCQVPLPDALAMTADAVRDPNLADGSRRLATQVSQGLPAESEARFLGHFPRSVVMLFRWQGRPQALARALRSSGELFATQARIETGVIGLFLQPLLLFFIVMFVGTTVTAMFMPLIRLLNELS